MAKLKHPNLITVFDSGDAGGMFYQISEYVHGKTLAHSSEGKAIDPATAVPLVEGIAKGIVYAHQNQVVHGNLRRASVLLTPDVTPKIGGFGTRDASVIKPKDDVRAIGVILYELLTGRARTDDAPPPSEICGCKPALDGIVRKAVENGDGSFKDAASLLAAIEEFQSGKGSRAVLAPAGGKGTSAIGRAPGAAPDAKPVPQSAAAGGAPSGGHLVRNLFIIALLLVTIYFVWGELKKAQAQRDRDNKQTAESNDAARRKALEEARLKREAKLEEMRNQQAANGTDGSGVSDSETTEESIARLRSALASGDRSEMPAGSRTAGDSFYVFLNRPMSWFDADRYARELGGHLAAPSGTTDVTWLAELAPEEGRCWIGAGRSGRSDWSLCDGSAWKPAKAPTGIGSFVSIDTHGLARTHNADESFGFIIQWHMDGSNPGGLESRLTAAGKSIASGEMIFPPGTRRFGNRLFLPVIHEVDWKAAKKLAWSAGGHLAVLTNVEEIEAASTITSGIDAPNGLWLAGFRDGDHWCWDTGEAWTSAKWAPDRGEASDDAALALAPGHGWGPRDRGEPASGFVIEWSSDSRSQTAENPSEKPSGADISSLTDKARELLANLETKRSKDLESNAKTFTWDLGGWLRNLSSTDQDMWGEQVSKLINSVEDNRVPASVPEESGVKLSEKMASIASYAARKQAEIDSAFATDARKIRDAFVPRLETAATDAQKAGQTAVAESIRDQISLASDLAEWTRSLGVELAPENPELEIPKRRGANNTRPENTPRRDRGGNDFIE
ncbi:MAG: protein kinase, partial [Verrucomicrobiae bacterium]|nr:protein kinase [Verrucomicrobiae bacterium]